MHAESQPGASSHAPAAAPKFFGKRLLWDPACTASALDRSGAVTGSTLVAGSDLHVAEMVDPIARNAAKTQACTSRTTGKMLPTRADVWEKETSTSHMYQKRGTCGVEATVTYTGKYSLDNGETWDTIPGTLETQATPLDIRVWSMRSVNVSGPCQPGNPSNDPTCKIQDFTMFKPRQTS